MTNYYLRKPMRLSPICKVDPCGKPVRANVVQQRCEACGQRYDGERFRRCPACYPGSA